jgi:hypothetical protein
MEGKLFRWVFLSLKALQMMRIKERQEWRRFLGCCMICLIACLSRKLYLSNQIIVLSTSSMRETILILTTPLLGMVDLFVRSA